jgi:iron complex outermembrane receptor protein
VILGFYKSEFLCDAAAAAQTRNKRALLLAGAAMSSSLLLGLPAHAQPTAQPSAQLGEIIVTARKRQESILNVPVIEQAIPQQRLQRFQTQDLKDVATLVPGVKLGDSVLSIGTQISIRGVGTTTFNPGVDQSVSLNIDGLTLTQGLAFGSGMFDMGQVEVLKGPQALFYGKADTAGVISIRTADPTDKFEVIAQAGYEFEAAEKQGQIIISGPVTDTLKLRFATQWDAQDGFYDNIAQGIPALGGLTPRYNTVSPDKGYMMRGTVLWNPTNAFDARLKINQVRDVTQENALQQMVSCPDGTGPVFGIQFMSPLDTCKQDRQLAVVDFNPASYGFRTLPNDGTPYLETTQTFGTLEMNYRPRPDLTVTSTTAYYLLHSTSMFNTSQSGAAGPILAVTNGFHRREFTEELRINSDFSGPLNFTAGAFFQRAQFSDLVTLYGNLALRLPPLVQTGVQTVDITTNSGFGQLRYKIIPQVELAAGARWTHEARSNTPFDLITGTPVFVNLAAPEITSDKISPEFTITYRPTEDLTVFGALKKGYKSGSFDTATPPTPGEDNAFGDEKVEGGEFGVKSRWLDRRLLANLAWYSYRYSGLQVGAIVPVENGVPVTKTINAGSSLVTGVEGDFAYRPELIEGLGLNAAVAWNHAVFKNLNGVPCYGGQTIAAGCNQEFSTAVNGRIGGFTAQSQTGLPLVRAPKWQTNFGFDYETDIGNDLKVVLSNNTQYSSKYLTGLGRVHYQDATFKTDVSIALQGPKDRWEFALVGKNLNNALTSGNCSNANTQGGLLPGTQFTGTNLVGPAGTDEIGCWMDRGREVWLRLTLRPFN